MDTIHNYLDNMFANLPKTSQMFKLKQDLLSNMEEKYYEHKNNGKSENEAVGIVISEFGNIDELISELGIENGKDEPILPTLTQEEAESYLATKKQAGLFVGIGVSLCIVGAALLIFLTTLMESNIFGPIALLLLVVPAIALFIYSGMKLEKYDYLQNPFDLPFHVKSIIQNNYHAFAKTFTVSLITGVCICVLSPVALLTASAYGDTASSYGVVVLLMMVAFAVFLFVYYGNIKESFSVLLKIGDYSKEKVEENKMIGAVAAIVWPLATCIFLVSGFIFDQWHINWIIFPITGILFGMFSAAYSIIKGRTNS